ncbi:hypothetical protein SDC9_179802 [bioreactor metagenome]|uniref:Uncharacterized protein n=1 Tax=bioreactor metagenome TaxID=1076179 RepID=A0A645H7R8_9ZZZZ
MQEANVGHKRHMQKARQNAGHKPVFPRNRRKRRAKQRRYNCKGRAALMHIQQVCEQHSNKNRNDVSNMLTVCAKPHNRKDAAHHRPVEFAAKRKHIGYADKAEQRHVDDDSAKSRHCRKIGRQGSRQCKEAAEPIHRPAVNPESEQKHYCKERIKKY